MKNVSKVSNTLTRPTNVLLELCSTLQCQKREHLFHVDQLVAVFLMDFFSAYLYRF